MTLSEPALKITHDRRVVEQVYEYLRERIVDGSLNPGARLVERALTDLGVSRTPIREALKRLEQDGLVVCLPHRGYRVRTAAPDEARRVYELRRALEGLAGELAAERATPEELRSMAESLESARSLLGADGPRLLALHNDTFHSLIVRATRNEFLVRELRWIWGYVHVLRGQPAERARRAGTILQQHERLLHALERRDPIEARQMSEEHVRESWRAVAERFSWPL